MSAQPTIPIALDGELTIYQAATIRSLLQPALADVTDGGTVVLDLCGVVECDGAGLQLLLVFVAAVAAAGGQLALLDAQAAVRDLLVEYGVASRFLLQSSGVPA